jgi:hypothetical protein
MNTEDGGFRVKVARTVGRNKISHLVNVACLFGAIYGALHASAADLAGTVVSPGNGGVEPKRVGPVLVYLDAPGAMEGRGEPARAGNSFPRELMVPKPKSLPVLLVVAIGEPFTLHFEEEQGLNLHISKSDGSEINRAIASDALGRQTISFAEKQLPARVWDDFNGTRAFVFAMANTNLCSFADSEGKFRLSIPENGRVSIGAYSARLGKAVPVQVTPGQETNLVISFKK